MAMISLYRLSKSAQKQTWPYYNSSRYDSWTIVPGHFPHKYAPRLLQLNKIFGIKLKQISAATN